MKDKIQELRLLGKSYNYIQKELGCSKSTISYHCVKLNLNQPINNTERVKRIGKIKEGERFCLMCNVDISNKPYRQRLCSHSCSSKYKNKIKYEKYILDWKEGLTSGGRGEKSGLGTLSRHVRKYIFEKYSSCCSLCKWSEINCFTNSIPLEIDHIDGDPMNHTENNLILLCPNCHSLTPGHSTSKGNGRRYYREKYKKEVCSTQ